MSIYCQFGGKRDRYFKIRLDRFVNNRCDRILAMHSTAFDANTSNSGILTQIHSSCISSIVDHSKTRRNNHKECRKEGTRTFRIESGTDKNTEGPNNYFSFHVPSSRPRDPLGNSHSHTYIHLFSWQSAVAQWWRLCKGLENR